jgi:hypothetical protein
MCMFHKYIGVEDVDRSLCGHCFMSNNSCPHSFEVCIKCGKAVGYGSHGKLYVIPDGCKAQIEYMRKLFK